MFTHVKDILYEGQFFTSKIRLILLIRTNSNKLNEIQNDLKITHSIGWASMR